jgi:hypothetical protein
MTIPRRGTKPRSSAASASRQAIVYTIGAVRRRTRGGGGNKQESRLTKKT